jgi:hypothetical protein
MTREESIEALLRCYSTQELMTLDDTLNVLVGVTRANCFQSARNLVSQAIKKVLKEETSNEA